jgi:hypothetical protein
VALKNGAAGGSLCQPEAWKDDSMATNPKNTPKRKRPTARGSHSPADQDFTCSEMQLDTLLSEGESTGQARRSPKDSSKVVFKERA